MRKAQVEGFADAICSYMPQERRVWWTAGRSCFNANGAPKSAFASKRAAEKAIPKTARGLHPYRCADHGWHLGHG